MIKDNSKYETFVRLWSSNDDWRDPIIKPICFPNGWVASTNSYKLLWVYDPEFINRENVHDFSKGDGANALKIMEEYKKFYEGEMKGFGKILVSDIEKVFEDIKMIPEYDKKYKDCSNCDGYGKVECDCCGHETDCDECDGEGNVECGEEETGEYKYPSNHYIKIHGNHLSLYEMREVVDYLKQMGIEELEICSTDSDIKSLFGIPGEKMYILIMGNMVEQISAHESKIYDIKICTSPSN